MRMHKLSIWRDQFWLHLGTDALPRRINIQRIPQPINQMIKAMLGPRNHMSETILNPSTKASTTRYHNKTRQSINQYQPPPNTAIDHHDLTRAERGIV